MNVADSLHLNELKSLSTNISLYYFNKVVRTEEFLQAHITQVIPYLSHQNLNVDNEFSVFEALINWLQKEPKRCEHIFSLVKCLNFKQLTNSDFQNILFYSEIQESSKTKDLIECMQFNVHKTSTHSCKNFCDMQLVNELLSKKQRCIPKVLCIVGHKRISDCKNVNGRSEMGDKPNELLHPYLFSFNVDDNKLDEGIFLSKITCGHLNLTEISGFSAFSVGKYLF